MCFACEIRKSGSSTVNPFCSAPLTGPQLGSRPFAVPVTISIRIACRLPLAFPATSMYANSVG
ncbi:hypothetical protein CBM2600_B30399 [Cupriavidus taiwanensis]|nr:hypothetical protein CBM2600_B30399 [Cupriavidus taiwanensis]